MDQIITFDKSLQHRLQEYQDIFSHNISVSDIKKEWSFFLEFTIDPNGWQAIWKIQRKTCESLQIPFPTIVLVVVLNVDMQKLNAYVRIIAVQDDDISLPDEHIVPLTQLWPTVDQDQSVALNLNSTANALDMLRFFYTNIFMPWDDEDDDTSNWIIKHLESRLRLYYDVKNGVIPRKTAEHLHSLLTEAKHLQIKRDTLENHINVGSEDELDIENNVNNNKTIEKLMELHIRLLEIKGEVDILENPLLRAVIIKRHQELISSNQNNNKGSIWLIFEEGKVDDYIKFLTHVQVYFPNEIVKFSSLLSTTLESANPNDIYILNESTHMINTTGALENGGILKGISSREKTTLTSNTENIMLDCNGKSIILENLTIEANLAQCAIVVRRGTVKLNNCQIIGDDNKSSTHQGIIVLSGANLIITDCDISNFSTAIVGNSGSTITIKNSEIHDTNTALKIYDNCKFNAEKISVYNCRDYGICIETASKFDDGTNQKIGSFDCLNVIPEIKTEHLEGSNNQKGDVIISQISKLRPLKDLFNNAGLDLTVSNWLNGMDTDNDDVNTTVKENLGSNSSISI